MLGWCDTAGRAWSRLPLPSWWSEVVWHVLFFTYSAQLLLFFTYSAPIEVVYVQKEHAPSTTSTSNNGCTDYKPGIIDKTVTIKKKKKEGSRFPVNQTHFHILKSWDPPAHPTKKLTANRFQFFGIITSEYLDQIRPTNTGERLGDIFLNRYLRISDDLI